MLPETPAWVTLPYMVPSSPPPAINEVPTISFGRLVIRLTTPVMALAPQTALPGPRTASICLISAKFTGRKSHITKPKKSR